MQGPHLIVPTIPVELHGPAGGVTFIGTVYCYGANPVIGGTLTVNGDTFPVPPQVMQTTAG